MHHKSTMTPRVVLHQLLSHNIEPLFHSEQDMREIDMVHYLIGVLYYHVTGMPSSPIWNMRRR